MSEQKQVKLAIKSMGKTGLKVSELCLGAMTFGKNDWGLPTTDEATSFQILDHFVAAGGNFIDTADVYGRGESEAILGKWLKSRSEKDASFRDKMVIATKCRGDMGKGVNDVGLSRKHIMQSVDDSLKRLQTDYIDLYQVHYWDKSTPLRETLSALNDLVHNGKVRYIGVSNFCGWQLQKALDVSEFMGWERFVCLQPEYNLLCRGIEHELVPLCKEEGLAVIPWSPLAGGWLSGKYKKDMQKPPSDSRVAWAEAAKFSETDWSSKNEERTWHIIDTVFKIAEEVKATPAQVSLRWVMQKPGITAPIIGAKNMTQLQDNIAAAGIVLSDDQMARLDKASDTPLPYPFSLLKLQGQFP